MLNSSSRYLPPGPRGKFIVGNLFDIPSTEQWIYFKQQADKLGESLLLWRCSRRREWKDDVQARDQRRALRYGQRCAAPRVSLCYCGPGAVLGQCQCEQCRGYSGTCTAYGYGWRGGRNVSGDGWSTSGSRRVCVIFATVCVKSSSSSAGSSGIARVRVVARCHLPTGSCCGVGICVILSGLDFR